MTDHPAPTSKDVIESIAEWLTAKKKNEEKKPTEEQSFGGFGFWGYPIDESKVVPEHEMKLARAQTILDHYVASKVEEVLQAIINENNKRHSPHRPQHELYPEKG